MDIQLASTKEIHLGALLDRARRKFRYPFIALLILLSATHATQAAVHVNIGINFATYPNLVAVPGYPVYYDPLAEANYFFYDGEYWLYEDDDWYSSAWYNGPWEFVEPEDVPLFVLRVPVRYYHRPPIYFRGWAIDASPRWGDHWGRDWERRRFGWNRWDRASVPPAAPLPVYQRQYSGNRYPHTAAEQQSIRLEKYRYQPRESITRQHLQRLPQQSTQQPQQQSNAPNRTRREPQQRTGMQPSGPQRPSRLRPDREMQQLSEQQQAKVNQETREQRQIPPRPIEPSSQERHRAQPPQQFAQPNRERDERRSHAPATPPAEAGPPERQPDSRAAPRNRKPQNQPEERDAHKQRDHD